MGSLVAEEAFKAAEAYFERNGVRTLLTDILIELGREQPANPLAAIRSQLEKVEKAQAARAQGLDDVEGPNGELERERLRHFSNGGTDDTSARPALSAVGEAELPAVPPLEPQVPQPEIPEKQPDTEEHDADSSLLQAWALNLWI